MDAFLTVGQQVLILFILIAIGVLCNTCRLVSAEAVKSITNIVLYCVTPCVLINSFSEMPFSLQKLQELLLVLLVAALLHIGMILLSRLLIHDKDDDRQRMLRFATVFSNAGYMGLPLLTALLGDEGAFFGGAYIAVFNIILWSYGLCLMSGSKKDISPRKLLLNPGLLGVLCGLIIFLMPLVFPQFHLPELIAAPVRHLANLNTPLPMLIIGFYLADINLSALRDWKGIAVVLLRIVALPLLALGAMYLCGLRGTMLISLTVSISTPIAAATTMFATKYNRCPATSSNLISLSTLLSAVSMPLIVGLAQMIA